MSNHRHKSHKHCTFNAMSSFTRTSNNTHYATNSMTNFFQSVKDTLLTYRNYIIARFLTAECKGTTTFFFFCIHLRVFNRLENKSHCKSLSRNYVVRAYVVSRDSGTKSARGKNGTHVILCSGRLAYIWETLHYLETLKIRREFLKEQLTRMIAFDRFFTPR